MVHLYTHGTLDMYETNDYPTIENFRMGRGMGGGMGRGMGGGMGRGMV